MTESFSSKRKAEELVSVGQLLDPMNECATRRKVDEASSCVAAAATAVAKAGSAVGCGAEKPSVPKNLMSNREIRRILARKPMVARSEYVALKESNPDLTPSPEEEMDESKKHLYFMARTFYSTEEHHRELQEWVRGELETKGYVELDDDRVRRRAEAKAELEELWKKVEALLLSETEDEDDDDESDSDYDDDDDDDDDELLDKTPLGQCQLASYLPRLARSNHRGDTHVGAALLASASSVSLLRRRPLLVQLRRKEYKSRSNGASGASTRNLGGRCNNNMKYSISLNDEPMPDAASEKEQGNEYFKQKKFAEAIDCYSRSIGLSPTAVAFANRAMAYLKLRRFKEAEDDCTEALDLDDRYIKAYSRRITARKELGKLKEAMDDAEFAVSIDPNNPELRKQYSEIKALHMEKSAKKTSVPAKRAVSGIGKTADKKDRTSHLPTISQKDSFMEVDSPVRAAVEIIDNADSRSKGGGGKINGNIMQPPRDAKQKAGSEASVQELASRAASLYMSSTVKSVKTPKTAYDFEVSWRALSDDTAQQIQLLKSIPPASLPEIFKNSLSAAFLIDIVKCSASISRDDTAITVSILENLVKVRRFDLIIMCLSSMHKSELRKIWDQVFLENSSADQIEILRKLRGKYIQGGR